MPSLLASPGIAHQAPYCCCARSEIAKRTQEVLCFHQKSAETNPSQSHFRFSATGEFGCRGTDVIRAVALLVSALTPVFSQSSPVPYAPNSDGPGPTFSSKAEINVLPGRYSSIQKVDFHNLRPLKNGRYQENKDGFHYSEELDRVYYLGAGTTNRSSALVLHSWFGAGGSSSQGGVAQVFSIVNGGLRSTQKITWDTHFQTGQQFVTFEESTNALVIRSAHYIPGDAHCCVSAMDVVTFRWDGAAFVQADLQTELSDYGRKAGKQLPR
jgi:hypothetical protein